MRILTRHVHRVTRHSFYQKHCIYLLPMAGWFLSSALLSAYNKFVFGQNGKIAFPCPLFLTSLHFGAQWAFSTWATSTFPETTGLARIQSLSWKEWLSISVPCGVVTAADVGLSNLSMVRLSLTFYTMVKASTPIFVLAWAWIFQIERITWSLVMVVAVIAVGEYLTVLGEVDFQWIGFVQCLVASVLSGARWTLVQLKLQTLEPPIKTSLATMRVLAPSMFQSLLVVAMIIERPWEHLVWHQFGYVVLLGSIGATAAIGMVLCEFMLIMQASAIVLMIGGVLKELLNIGVGMAFFGDRLNLINTLGFSIVFAGVILYKLSFHGSHAAVSERAPIPATAERYGPVARSESELRPKSDQQHSDMDGNRAANSHGSGGASDLEQSNGYYAPSHRIPKDHSSDDGSYRAGLHNNDEENDNNNHTDNGLLQTKSSDEGVEGQDDNPVTVVVIQKNNKDGLMRLSTLRRSDSDTAELRESSRGTLT